jgi:hypothetical protein
VVLENDILKATFMPVSGGRLWSLYHKPEQRELLNRNPVFQPANLANRNAWFSGGSSGTSVNTGIPLAPAHLSLRQPLPAPMVSLACGCMNTSAVKTCFGRLIFICLPARRG